MKFKDKDGNVFEDIDMAITTACQKYDICEYCPIAIKRMSVNCVEWCQQHSAKAASLMGYEVVEDNTDTISENMTVSEAIEVIKTEIACVKREICERQECTKCDLVMPTEKVLAAYSMAISALQQQKES